MTESSVTRKGTSSRVSQQRIIQMMSITDLIAGTMYNEDARIISIVTESHTLDLQVLDEMQTDPWIQALASCLVFLNIPVCLIA